GPTPFAAEWAGNGRSHVPFLGSGTHTLGAPSRIGMPSAPGNVPKYESNERFSCMITTTWRILWIPWSTTGLCGDARPPPLQASPTNAKAPSAASSLFHPARRRRALGIPRVLGDPANQHATIAWGDRRGEVRTV